MKKVIDRHTYDTTTAKRIGKYESQEDCTDFCYYEETLYRTKPGLYFIHGSGNANTVYAQKLDSGFWGPGQKITPVSAEDAKKWAEKHLSGAEYEEAFGKESQDTTGVLLNVPDALLERIDKAKGDQTRTDFILCAVRNYIK